MSWLVDKDSAPVISEARDQIKQKYMFAVLYSGIENVSWLLDCGFMGDQYECSWSCDYLMNNAYNARLVFHIKRVTFVKLLSCNRLSGTIPTELGYLSELIEIYLNYNKLVGTILPTLGHFTKLKLLQLSDNDRTGNIPSELSVISSVGA